MDILMELLFLNLRHDGWYYRVKWLCFLECSNYGVVKMHETRTIKLNSNVSIVASWKVRIRGGRQRCGRASFLEPWKRLGVGRTSMT
jgi:hypothetical protein